MKKKPLLALLTLALGLGACTDIAQAEVVELSQDSALTTGISVTDLGIFLLTQKDANGIQEIQHLSLEGELLERTTIEAEGEFYDIFQIDARSFALATNDEVSRYDSVMGTIEPFYCFEPGFIGEPEPDPSDPVAPVDPNDPDLLVHAIATQPSERLFWGTQRSLEDGNELRAYRFGETEQAAFVFELSADLEPSGLVMGTNAGLLIEESGALHAIDLETGALTATQSVLDGDLDIDGMDAHEGVLYIYERGNNEILKIAVDDVL